MVVAEGNVFQNIPTVYETPIDGQLFNSPSSTVNTYCDAYLGHNCQVNGYGTSGSFSQSDEGLFSDFSGKTIASASAYTAAQSTVPSSAGQGNL